MSHWTTTAALIAVLTPLALAATPGATAPPPLQEWIVDAAGGGDFLEIQDAVASALVLDGDSIRVRTGIYTGFTVNQKGLTIFADTGHQVDVQGASLVRALLPAQITSLVDLRLAGGSSGLPGLFLVDNDGAVAISACTVKGGFVPPPSGATWVPGLFGVPPIQIDCNNMPGVGAYDPECESGLFDNSPCPTGRPGLLVRNSTQAVVIDDTILLGGSPEFGACIGGAGGIGLQVENMVGTVTLVDCQVSGADGSSGGRQDGAEAGVGGVGLRVENALVDISMGRMRGGDGGSPTSSWGAPGDGAHAIQLVGNFATALIDQVELVGGTPGCNLAYECGAAGDDVANTAAAGGG